MATTKLSFDSGRALDDAARILGGRALMAQKLNVSTAAIGNWKVRGIPIEQCVSIERATNGAVGRRDLRPEDYPNIWPELVISEDAKANQPKVIDTSAQEAINPIAQTIATEGGT